METISFGLRETNGSYKQLLMVCNETKEYEKGEQCINGFYVNVWVEKQIDLDTIERHLISIGYTRTEKKFGSK